MAAGAYRSDSLGRLLAHRRVDEYALGQQGEIGQGQNQPQSPGGQGVEEGLPWAKVAWASA